MAFELNIFGAAIEFGSFSFFDLMDDAPAAAPVNADIFAFETKVVEAPATFEEAALQTAA